MGSAAGGRGGDTGAELEAEAEHVGAVAGGGEDHGGGIDHRHSCQL